MGTRRNQTYEDKKKKKEKKTSSVKGGGGGQRVEGKQHVRERSGSPWELSEWGTTFVIFIFIKLPMYKRALAHTHTHTHIYRLLCTHKQVLKPGSLGPVKKNI